MLPYCIVFYGPTGVGKSDLAESVAKQVQGEIVNLDMGQCYTPLTIGTAKPDYQKSSIPHHLFDIIDEPRQLTVTEYRARVLQVINDICARNKMPILVGGSSFYALSLFYPPLVGAASSVDHSIHGPEELRWQRLHERDPERAQKIHPHDMYRINRALDIILSHNQKASSYVPVYEPIAPYYFCYISRDRSDLYNRIDCRVIQMIKDGWIEEVEKLIGTPWEDFLKEKKIIGYDDIIDYLHGQKTSEDFSRLVARIQKKTRNYAKRQICFARSFVKKLHDSSLTDRRVPGFVQECDLTLTPIDLYLKELLSQLNSQLRVVANDGEY